MVDPVLSGHNTIQISRGYPGENSDESYDYRSGMGVMYALNHDGKLSEPLTLYSYDYQPDTSSNESLAIYLTRDDIPAEKMPLYSGIEIASEPVITIDDILSYDWVTHDIVLTAEAYEKLAQLKVPMLGKSFVVCINRVPVYWGAFWSLLSSALFEGPSSVCLFLLTPETHKIPSPSVIIPEEQRERTLVLTL